MQRALTDAAVRSLPQGTYFDTKTMGFAIRIGKNRKTWIAVKGPREKRVQEILGHYPYLSLADARRKALVALGSPLEEKAAPKFPDALAVYLGQNKWRPASLKVITSSLRHFTWTRPIDKITHEDVENALKAIEGRSARHHAFKDIRAFFNYCIPRYLKHSPCVGIKMGAQPTRSRVLTDAELKALWNTAEGRFAAIIKLLILSGQRKSEIAKLRLEWVSEDRVTLPPSATKNGKEHTFPLTPYMRQLVDVAIGNRPLSNLERHKKSLAEKSQVSDWTLHDLRRTFATNLAALGVEIHVTEKLLNHVSGSLSGVAGIYNRFAYWDKQVAAVQAWEERVLSLARQ